MTTGVQATVTHRQRYQQLSRSGSCSVVLSLTPACQPATLIARATEATKPAAVVILAMRPTAARAVLSAAKKVT